VTDHAQRRGARLRWATASELLRLLYREPGITRRDAGARLGMSSGALTDTVERLREASLLSERRAATAGRGRPTTTLIPHEHGPLVIVVDLRPQEWVVSLADLAGAMTAVTAGAYAAAPASALGEIAAAVEAAYSSRVRAVVTVAAGTVSGTRLVQFPARGWADLELSALVAGLAAHVDFLAGNDATLAGVAEAATPAAAGARVVLYLLVTEGLGGALVVDGQPVPGAHGRGGEFGHLPFGDPALECPCGARGCWGRTVDGAALARLAGHPEPSEPEVYARRMLADPAARGPAQGVAAALGAGIAGLVNAHDPDLVILGGLAPLVRAAAPDTLVDRYTRGLMLASRAAPPPVLDSTFDAEGPARGAVRLGLDHITDLGALARWKPIS
jgi:predicted NBD/HSP70 family sugar kinase